MPKAKVGKASDDHGGHQKALNFCAVPWEDNCNEIQLSLGGSSEEMAGIAICPTMKKGDCTIGMVHEGDWKAKSSIAGNGQRKMCLKSEKHCPFLCTTKEILLPKLESTLAHLTDDAMRVNLLRGATTLPHNDSHKGNSNNWFCTPKEPRVEPGHLVCDTFPKFKHSVVKTDGKLCTPHQPGMQVHWGQS